MGSEQHYSLRWNDYTVKIVTAFQSLRDEEDFVDVTVACDGHSYSAHKMVLSACSPYFRALLRANPCQHPIVILKDVGHVELERLLEFMYNGEVSIAQDQLATFLKTAENLKIRGLAGSSDDLDPAGIHRPDVSYSYTSGGGAGGATSGRSSPSAGYAPSQSSKDDDVMGEGGGGGGGSSGGGGGSYHARPDSPPPKRRKRSSAPAAGHSDTNTTSHTAEGVVEASVEVETGASLSSGGGLTGDEDMRLDRRELKSEPAMPGPSGGVGSQDGVGGTHEPGAAPPGGANAVCEALNLSLRPPLPPLPQPQANGTLHQSPLPPHQPTLLSHHHHHHHHQQQQQHLQRQDLHHHQQPPLHHHHQPPPTLHHHHHQQQQQQSQQQSQQMHPLHHQHHQQQQQITSAAQTITHAVSTDTSDTFEVKISPGVSIPVYPEDALDLAPESKMVGGLVEVKEDPGLLEAAPEYKTKLYPCPECHKVFRHPMSLHHHRHVHKGTYTCHSCGKVFSRRWDLHRHLHRSKMGCRRPNHLTTTAPNSTPSTTPSVTVSATHRAEFAALDLNNPPSN